MRNLKQPLAPGIEHAAFGIDGDDRVGLIAASEDVDDTIAAGGEGGDALAGGAREEMREPAARGRRCGNRRDAGAGSTKEEMWELAARGERGRARGGIGGRTMGTIESQIGLGHARSGLCPGVSDSQSRCV